MNMNTGKRVLDPCCGSRMFWFDRENPEVLFGDIRREEHILCDGRSLSINPDVDVDFRAMQFEDESFNLVVFDPPHLRHAGDSSWMKAKYGRLSDDWRADLSAGFSECFRVLKTGGTLVFKWNETQIKVKEVLALAPRAPLFGHVSGRKGLTHWVVWLK